MNYLRKVGAGYFAAYIFQLILGFIAALKLNATLTAILLFIIVVLKFPKNLTDLLLQSNSFLQGLILFVSFLCFVSLIID